MKKPNGYIIYQGPSLLDHKPIVVIALLGSSNSKTGDMIQTYILRSDMDPRLASKTGQDYSICGTCPMRGTPTNDPKRKQAKDRPCYVILGQGPTIVYKNFQAGNYPNATGYRISRLAKDRKVRLGTYGDPGAVPGYIWDRLLILAKGHTGYSHQASTPGADYNPDILMYSADSLEQARQAWAKNYRTFRVVKNIDDLDKDHEILCPASEEAGRKTTCIDCQLCKGAAIKAKSIVIVAHGNGKNYV